MNSFEQALIVEQRGMSVLLPFLESRAWRGQVIQVAKGPRSFPMPTFSRQKSRYTVDRDGKNRSVKRKRGIAPYRGDITHGHSWRPPGNCESGLGSRDR
jgi:hypothetical protein